MANYNNQEYIKYKKRQELLNRKQVTLILDKDIAETLQKYMRKHSRITFEHQLKSHFLKKPLVDILQSHDDDQIGKAIPHVNILLDELKQELQVMGNKMAALQEKLEILTSQHERPKDHIESMQLSSTDDFSVPILNKSLNISKRSRIPNIVLDLAIDLYKKLNSWKQVCDELAKQGYLSHNNKFYTASSLSRAVSRYKLAINKS